MPAESRAIPTNSLAHLYPGGFNEFWQELEFKKELELVIYHYVPATDEQEEIKKTLASGGLGLNAVFIVKYFADRYWYSKFEPYEDVYLSKFKSNCLSIVAEIRRKEWLWTELFKDLKKLLEKKKLQTETRASQNYDKTQTIGGKTVNTGNEKYNSLDQKQTKEQITPIFSNVNLGSGQFGGFQRQNQLASEQTEQNQSSRNSERKNTIDKVNHRNKEAYRALKDANVTTISQDSYELANVLKSRLIGNFEFTIIKLSDYHPLFDKLMVKMFGCSVVPIIDPVTGRRRWVSQAQYEETVEEESGTGRPRAPEGNEWDESFPYLERLKIYHAKNEKELKKLPESSNRKPRVAIRVKTGEGLIPAYERDIELPAPELFLSRIRGEIEGYQKVIGYEDIIGYVVDYLKGWEFHNEFGGNQPQQLMVGLVGDPGLGKTYICETIGKALGAGYHMISLNGQRDASIVYGTNIENPGAEIGQILKGISRSQSRKCLIFFDEIEKAAGKEAKDAIGNPTDRTVNKNFRDNLFDFPTPLDQVIYFCALNYLEELPDFINDRFRMIEVQPPSYQARLAILKAILSSEFKSFDNAFRRIYNKAWTEIYSLFNQEELLKKALTKTFSIRGAKDNMLGSFIPKTDFLMPRRALPNEREVIDYDWGFNQKEDLDLGDRRRGREPCPYAVDETRMTEHREGCRCFVNNLDRVSGWRENMEN